MGHIFSLTLTAIVHHFKLNCSLDIIIIMKVSVIATVALLSLLALASSAPHRLQKDNNIGKYNYIP